MSTNFPTSLDSYSARSSGQVVASAHINNLQDAVAALEAKVGVNSSAVTTSLDYLVSHAAATDYGSVPASVNGFKAWNYDPQYLVSTVNTPATGALQVIRMYASSALSLTKAYIITASSPTSPTHFIGALYDSSGNILQTSADNSAALAGGGLKTLTFSATAVPVGQFFFCWWYTAASTMDTAALNDLNGYGNINLTAAQSRFATANTGLTTAAPSSIGTKTAAAKPIWAAVG